MIRIALFAAVLATAQAGEIVFDLAKPLHRFEGIGVNCWPGDDALPREIEELGLRWARLWIGSKLPAPAGEDAACDAWWQGGPGNDRLAETLKLFKERGVRVIAGMGNPPAEWMEGKNKHFRPDKHAAFARLWAAGVAHLKRVGGEIHGIELYNEPDGGWSVHVDPEENASLIRLVRQQLDARGFQDVLICAPGTSHSDWGYAGDPYVNVMTPATVNAVGAWANHSWEWSLGRLDDPMRRHVLRIQWPNVLDSFRRKDPEGKKPVYVTESGTGEWRFHNRDWETYVPADQPDRSKYDAPPIAARVVENFLSLANHGANAVLFWQATDLSWSDKCDGLLRSKKLGHTPRPTYLALQSFAARIPPDARMASWSKQDENLYGACFVGSKNALCLVVNGNENEARSTLTLQGAAAVTVRKASMFAGGATMAVSAGFDATTHSCAIALPGDSLLVIELASQAAPEK